MLLRNFPHGLLDRFSLIVEVCFHQEVSLVSIQSKALTGLLLISVNAMGAPAFLEDITGVQLPPSFSTACNTNPDPDHFLIRYSGIAIL
jgi:hypothetical protein